MWNVILWNATDMQLICQEKHDSLLQLIWPRRFHFAGDMTNLSSFIQGLLE